MANSEPPQSTGSNSSIHTGGAAYVGGDVDTHVFVGRDNVTVNLTINVAGAELRTLAADLTAALASPDATLHAGTVSAGGRTIAVSPALADALRQYQDAAPGATQASRERQYLQRLCVDPDFYRWQQRYVALAGGFRSAPELTPSYSAIRVRGEGPQRQIERVALPDIRTALEQHAVFILLAQPGAGKTTVLERMALDKAVAVLQDKPEARVPLFVRLSDQGEAESPHDFLARMWRERMPGGGGDAQAELREALRQGRLCLLVDGLNEARRANYDERMYDWRAFAARLPAGSQLVFSCRALDYNGELAVQQVEIDPLQRPQIEEFAQRYLGEAKGAACWAALHQRHPDLLELAAVPYYLHMLVEVFDAENDLPPNRALLFEHFVQRLFTREQPLRHAVPWIEPAAQHLALSELAYAIQELRAGTQVELALALSKLPAQVTLPNGKSVATPPADVLDLARAASLLAGRGDAKVAFMHHLLLEYFAADSLLRRLAAGQELGGLWRAPVTAAEMPAAERGEWDPLPGPPTIGWEETTILAAGLDPALYDVVRPVNPALAARCLLESGVAPTAARTQQSQDDLLARLGHAAVHLRSRIEAGLLLGRLGDPRFAVETINGVKVILPPLVNIAAAAATIGSGRDDELADGDEFPACTAILGAYAIGRYPVTNVEYACFMAAGGYENEAYWTAGGRYWRNGQPAPGEEDPADWWIRQWRRYKADPAELDRLVASGQMTTRDADNPWRILIAWNEDRVVAQVREWYPQDKVVREPRYWRDDAFNNLSQPVVGVCWYEAMAYANWLAAVTRQPYRLPSEPEWEWAARRGARMYPWGSAWDAAKLNSLEGEERVMRPTPVGAYPQGATPDGIADLAGNVWEWTATRYAEYPYRREANLEDPDATGLRITRGGGWAANRKMVRCACRAWLDPWLRFNGRGFRLARTSL